MKIPFISEYFIQKRKEKRQKIFDYAKTILMKDIDYELIYKSYVKYSSAIIKDIPSLINFEKFKEPDVSIIIPVYNQYEYTMKCLESIKIRTNCSYEIILIDDCSTDETVQIENKVKNIKIIRNTINQGFLKNCNKAVSIAKGKYLYFLNNDTQVMLYAIDLLLKTMQENERCGAVGSKLIFPDGKLQSAGSEIDKKTFRPILIGMHDNPLKEEYNQQKVVDYSCGASLLVRKSVWGEGFDEIYSPGYFEETDFCLRLKDKGYDVIYCPDSEVIHFTSQSFGEKNSALIERNYKIFKDKRKNQYGK